MFRKIPNSNKCSKRISQSYKWISLTKECNTCEFCKDIKKCILNGVVRNIFTKGKIKNYCYPKRRRSKLEDK